ncbi:MAG: hypothetical protein Q8K71_15430 [Polaromonas sp.]|jgi:hypothetical protein|nr:hypothetical protein [Hylemonella sp.]MDP1955864.1 hypothetical protein [Polaromonas sp.]
MKQNKDLNKLLEQIAKEHLFIETLETQHSDRLDFHDVAVWCIKSAMEAAYAAGIEAGKSTSTTSKGKQ